MAQGIRNVVPIRRKPTGTKWIRFNHSADTWQRMGTFGHWYNITPAIARVLRDQGFMVWDMENEDGSRCPGS
jgi:hypothetical protein